MTINVFIHSLENSMLKVTAGSGVALSQSVLNEYPERAFLLAKKNDFIILEHSPDENYLNYLIENGIGTRNILIPTAQGESLSEKVLKDKELLNFLRSLNSVVLHPYMSTQAESQIAKLINARVNGSSPEFTEEVNNKLFLVKFLEKIGGELPKYEIANLMNVVKITKKFQKEYGNIIIIGKHSYAGLAVWPIKNKKAFEDFQAKIQACETQFLIEKLYDVLYSPNIQYQINDKTIKFLGMTDQILDEKLEHHGNSYPSLASKTDKIKIKKYASHIANELKLQGYRGLLGIDFIQTTEGKVFAVDINGRVNASTFGLNINKKKPFITLTQIKIIPKITFIELKEILGENIFNSQTGTGILPYNIGFLKRGHFSAIIIGNTKEECKEYFASMEADFKSK
jgi:hypothetical protein